MKTQDFFFTFLYYVDFYNYIYIYIANRVLTLWTTKFQEFSKVQRLDSRTANFEIYTKKYISVPLSLLKFVKLIACSVNLSVNYSKPMNNLKPLICLQIGQIFGNSRIFKEFLKQIQIDAQTDTETQTNYVLN